MILCLVAQLTPRYSAEHVASGKMKGEMVTLSSSTSSICLGQCLWNIASRAKTMYSVCSRLNCLLCLTLVARLNCSLLPVSPIDLQEFELQVPVINRIRLLDKSFSFAPLLYACLQCFNAREQA